jgi:hypothetical protein
MELDLSQIPTEDLEYLKSNQLENVSNSTLENLVSQGYTGVPEQSKKIITKLKDTPYEGWESDALGYGGKIGTSDLGYLANMARSKFPNVIGPSKYKKVNRLGKEVWTDGMQIFSEEVALKHNQEIDDFKNLPTYDSRREYLKNENIRNAEEAYPNLTPEMKDSGYALTGEIGGSLLSPTTLLAGPAALYTKGDKLWKAATKFGLYSGLWGAEYSTVKQLAEEGEIDPKQLATDTILATGGGVVLRGGAPIVYKGIKSSVNKTSEEVNKLILKNKTETTADDFIQELNLQAAKIIRNDGGINYLNNPKQYGNLFTKSGVLNEQKLTKVIKEDLIKKTGVTKKQLGDIEKNSPTKFNLPKNQTEADTFIAKKTYSKYTNEDTNPFKHKVLQNISSGLVKTQRGIDSVIRPAAEFLQDSAPEIANGLVKMDYNILTKHNRNANDIKSFFEKWNTLNKQDKIKAKEFLSDGKFEEFSKNLDNPNLKEGSFPQFEIPLVGVRKTLERLRIEGNDAGIRIDKIEKYFPRFIKNYNKYNEKLTAKIERQGGTYEVTQLSKVKDKLTKQTQKDYGREPDAEELADAYNKFLAGGLKDAQGGGLYPSRIMKQIDKDMIDEYLDPLESLEKYIINSVSKTEKSKFIGKYARLGKNKNDVKIFDTGNKYLLEESIGNMSNISGLSDARLAAVQKVLRARLIDGEQGSGLAQPLKNISYITLLGNPSSAIVQAGDIGFSAAQNGMFNSTKNLLKQMTRQKFGDKLKYNIEEIGLGRTVSAEIANTGKGLDKAVEKVFDWSQFTRVDRVGKTTTINSALDKATNVVKLNNKGTLANPKQFQQFKNKWEGVLGKDNFVNMVAAIRTGRKTDDVGYYLFSELSEVQPISLSQMPVKYLTAKEGKIFYALKSFALKQFDFARKKILREIGRGKFKSAFKNTLVLSAYLGGSQTATKQLQKLLVGSPEEIKIENMPNEFAENLLKIILLNKYNVDKLSEDKNLESFVYETISPPLAPIWDIGSETLEYFEKPETVDELMNEIRNPKIPFEKSRRYIPIGGTTYSEQTVKKPKRQEKELKELLKGLDL